MGTLTAIAVEEGVAVSYVKPHGALYHRVREDAEQAAAVLAGSGHLPVLGQHGVLLDLAAGAGRATYREGFADRAYRGDTLVPRDEPGALIEDVEAIAAQAVDLVPKADSICVHGDSPNAVEAARAVRRALTDAGSSWWPRGDRRVGARGAGGRASGRRARVHDLHPRAADGRATSRWR